MYGFETLQFAPDGITTTHDHDLCRHKNSQFTKYLPFLKKVMAALKGLAERVQKYRSRGVLFSEQSTVAASNVVVINKFKPSIPTVSDGRGIHTETLFIKKVMAASLELGDLALRFQEIFWGMSYHDLSTIAFSVVVINGVMTPPITTVSGGGIHAEIGFIRQAYVLLMGQIQGVNIEITINLSKSPCFRCTEDLEDFLESLTQRGATVTFTLRIANLYSGVGGAEGELQNIEYLTSWLSHLKRENVVNRLVIQPISVVTKIPHYEPRVINDKWVTQQERRRTDDRNIVTIVNTVDQQRAIAQRPQETRPLFTTLTEVIENSAELKRTFVESHATSAAYVGVAQVQINAQNNFGRIKGKVFIPTNIKSTMKKDVVIQYQLL